MCAGSRNKGEIRLTTVSLPDAERCSLPNQWSTDGRRGRVEGLCRAAASHDGQPGGQGLGGTRQPRSGRSAAFTLLELLAVIAILVIVAGAVVFVAADTEEQAADQLVEAEIVEIKKAVLQFKRDTGWLPKQGPFALVADGGVIDPSDDNHWPLFAPPAGPAREAWFHSPANFWELYENPLEDNSGILLHPLGRWNPNTARGWRGPYLTQRGPSFVSVGDGLNEDGNGKPTDSSSGDPLVVPSTADRFHARPSGAFFQWTTTDGKIFARWGRPYLLFGLHLTDRHLLEEQARLMSMGRNGIYESSFDPVTRTVVIGGDDTVLYFFR